MYIDEQQRLRNKVIFDASDKCTDYNLKNDYAYICSDEHKHYFKKLIDNRDGAKKYINVLVEDARKYIY